MRWPTGILSAIVVAGLAMQAPQAAPAAAEEPDAFIERLAVTAIDSLTAKDLDPRERQDRFRALLRDGMDLERVGAFVLGPYRRQATEDQIERFQTELEDYVVASYAWRFGEYSGESFEVADVREGRRGAKIVKSTLHQQDGGPPINVEWHVSENPDGWKIFDIVVERLSMMVTQREDFVAVIKRGGGDVDVLIDELRKKNRSLTERMERRSQGSNS